MAYICSVCGVHIRTISGLCCHLRVNHGNNALTTYKCGQVGCFRQYDSTRSFRKHLRKEHPIEERGDLALPNHEQHPGGPPDLHVNDLHHDEAEVPGDNVEGDNEVQNAIENEAFNDIGVVEYRNLVFQSALALTAKLYSSLSLNRTEIQNCLDHVNEFSSYGFLDVLKAKTLSALRENNATHEQITDITEMFQILSNSFEGLETEHQRGAVMKDSGCLFPLEPYDIGVGERRRHVNGVLVVENVELQGQFISMKKVLKKFLEFPRVFADIESNIERLKASNKFSNFIQGSLWTHIERTHFENKKVLPLFVYYDDVEPVSESGSHSVDYKVGTVYYQIPCIPQHLVSKLKYIFVAAIFLSTARGLNNGAAFSPILDELAELEQDGLQIVTETGEHRVYFSLASILGDNLAQNQILGFVESFSANFFCRFCKEHRRNTHFQFQENVLALRNRLNYQADLAINDFSHTGIKSNCCWNRLQTFHVTQQASVDIMHDLFEGVCHYILCPILQYLIVDCQFFSIETLNERVLNFDFARSAGQRPPYIKLERLRESKLKMSASEMMFFVSHLGIMVGDLVPAGDEVWELYKIHVKIVDILKCPYARRNEVEYLSGIISEHHALYCRLFNQTLKPKFHFMIHYPRLMLLLGPLIHLWSMRMEGKHRPVVKVTSDNTTCHKNLPVTLATRYVYSLCGEFLLEKGFPDTVFYHSKVKPILDCENYQAFEHLLHVNHEDFLAVPSVEVSGTLYAKNKVVAIDYENDEPLFGEIKWIVKRQNYHHQPLLLLTLFHTIGFDEHLHAYMVRGRPEWLCIEQTNLLSFHTSATHTGADGETYIVFPHSL